MAVIEEIEADSDDLVGACDTRVRCADAETWMTLSCASLSYAKVRSRTSTVWQTDGLPVSSIRKDKQDRTAAAPDKRDVQRSVAGRWVDRRYSCDRRRICEIAKAI